MRCKDYVDVFSKDMAETLATHWPIDHTIVLEPSFNLPYSQIYILCDLDHLWHRSSELRRGTTEWGSVWTTELSIPPR